MSVFVRFSRGGSPIESPSKFVSVEFNRREDEVGEAFITYPNQQGQCCEFVTEINHTDIVDVYVDDRWEYRGWVTNVRSDEESGNLIVTAVDAIRWLDWRRIRNDHLHTNVDLTTIFVDYWTNAMIPGDEGIELVTFPTGITATREVFADDGVLASDAVQDLLDSGLDIFAVGNIIVVGPANLGTIQMNSSDFNGKPAIVKDIEPFGNSFFGVGDGITSECTSDDSQFPVIERIVELDNVTDQAELDATIARYCESQDMPMVFLETPGQGGMLVNCKHPLSDLLPTLLVIFDGTDVCGGFVDRYEISSVRFVGTPRAQFVNVGLSPVGPVTASFS
jgi:hypothetical protein